MNCHKKSEILSEPNYDQFPASSGSLGPCSKRYIHILKLYIFQINQDTPQHFSWGLFLTEEVDSYGEGSTPWYMIRA
jgi:hypothetical protein